MEASRRVLVSIAVLGITSAADSNVARWHWGMPLLSSLYR
jgi:hypothetical protein